MKNALILHGTSGSHTENWFPWLQRGLEAQDYKVWTPDLPGADKPNLQRYNQFLLEENAWKFNEESIIVGHSSGAVAILGLLQALPEKVMVKACYLVGSFKDDLNWEALSELFLEPFDFAKIRQTSRLFYFLHSDNDPYCPLSHAEYLHNQIGGDLIVLPGQKHFSVGTFGEAYRQFPYLLQLIKANTMTQETVLELYTDLEKMGIKIWLDGGWGVDALLGKQTRDHSDLDIVIQQKDLARAVEYLHQRGYTKHRRGDEQPWNFIMGDSEPRFVDFHVMTLDEQGVGIIGPVEKGWQYPAGSLEGTAPLAHS